MTLTLQAIHEERARLAEARAHIGYEQRAPESAPLPEHPTLTRRPVLRAGVDRFPARCPACRGGLLSAEPPMGESRYGTLSCAVCGHVLAWVGEPLRGEFPAPGLTGGRTHAPIPLSEPDWRRPGCTIGCQRGSHSPEVHEAFGRDQALAEIAAQQPRRSGVVRTGSLALDLDTESVTVSGQAVALTPIELQILLYLAERVGTLCPAIDIVRAVWGEEQAQMEAASGSKTCHILNVNITRTRKKIGADSGLIETAKARGYRLLKVEPSS